MSVAQNLTALSPTTYASQSPKNTQFWNPIKFRLVLYLGLMKRFWGKGTGCRFYTPHDGQHFNFGSTNNFFRHCCPWHKCAWRQIISKREVFFHPGISSWKGLKLSSKGTSSFSLFFFKSFKSVWFLFHFRPWWWIQYNHKENQNGTHAHSSQLSTITIKIMTHTGKSGPFFCDDMSFLSSSSSFSLDNNALACSARSLALCLAYIFFTCSTPALLELFSSTNFWETWDKAAFSLKSRVIWGCFGSIYQILLFDWTS